MKTQSQNLFKVTGKTSTDSLNSLVPEPGVKSVNNSQSKTFSSVDLWNIHRQRKTIVIR